MSLVEPENALNIMEVPLYSKRFLVIFFVALPEALGELHSVLYHSDSLSSSRLIAALGQTV